jgi:hypothetical protein
MAIEENHPVQTLTPAARRWYERPVAIWASAILFAALVLVLGSIIGW